MRRASCVVLIGALLVGVGTVWAKEPKRVPQEVLDSIVDDPDPLPRHRAPWEPEFIPVWRDSRAPHTPPSAPPDTPAEYERNDGLLIAWDGFQTLLTQMTVGITTGTDATVWVVVDSVSEQNSATSTLSSAGADMNQVEFIVATTDSVWIRDYGPRFIREGGSRSMVDHTYNRTRPNDNAFPDALAVQWGETQYDIPLTHGGGNFHLWGDGSANMTELITDENPGLSDADVQGYYQSYQGLDLTITEAFDQSYDWTQHIDMWMLPVATGEVMIGQYSPADVNSFNVTEGVASNLEGLGYTVYRTPGWSTGYYGTHYTYTNSLILNEMVLACQFANASSSYADEDAAALAVFQTAFPDRIIYPVDCSDIIDSAGAIHCIVMHVPDVTWVFDGGFERGDLSKWSAVTDS
jgi:agmatine deiminase